MSTGPLDVTIGNAVDALGLFLQAGNNVPTGTNFRQANPPSDDVRVETFAQLASQTTYQVFAEVRVPSSGYFDPCAIHSNAIVMWRSQLIGSFTTR